ncbi:MAG TPA: YifB family Mg chelatase-like AAA ATPase [Rhodanobacteraceae bacterium]|nr:YifB family Mg chelatase-like AAA ATPase [Rhodanobacteraceae bacterium]
MSLAVALTRASEGVAAPLVTVEVHLSGGLPGTSIVGLPEAAVREARDRVRVAIQNTQFEYPARRVTVNLAPAELPKDGGRFDLAIALGILAAGGQVPGEALKGSEFLGELALSGELRPVPGVLPALLRARHGKRCVIVPAGNAHEAALLGDVDVRVARTLAEVCAHLRGIDTLPAPVTDAAPVAGNLPDLADVRGQLQARRALEIAAAGGHHLLMIGPPGTGKSMLAQRLPGILPPMTDAEAIEACAVRSVAHEAFDVKQWHQRPFRAPHHTASGVALVGGGSHPRPGEISLAHHGVLFLDELPEYDRRVLEVLREPMESGHIVISRAARQAEFPARFQLVAAMNPCPCGYAGDNDGRCHCTPDAIARYRGRISGPLLDRIDLISNVPRMPLSELDAKRGAHDEDSATVRARVVAARTIAMQRAGKPNAMLATREIERDCALGDAERALLERALEKLSLSARAYHRVLRVARTIADLAGSERIAREHLAEAVQYRRASTATV